MRLGADVQSADPLWIDARSGYRRATGRNGNGDRVLVEAGYRLLLQEQPSSYRLRILAPLPGDLVCLDSLAGDERAVADDACHVRLLTGRV
jgi:hypothetical protein